MLDYKPIILRLHS